MLSRPVLPEVLGRPSRAPIPRSVRRRRYRFFDTGVLVRSDVPEMLSLLDAMFASFAVAEKRYGKATDGLVCSVLKRQGDRAQIRIDGREYRVEQRDVVGLCYIVLLRATLRRIRSHLLLHAGVLERRGRGVLLVGGSGSGKSTLALELVRRGFKLLSDDVAAIRLADNMVEPFPRSLGIVPLGGPGGDNTVWAGGPLDLEAQVPHEQLSGMPLIGGGEKLLIRPEALGAGRIGRACPPALLVFLPGGPERSAAGEYLHVVLNALPEGLRGALEALPEISEVQTVPNRLFPELRFRSAGPGRALRQIDAACARFSIAILETSRGDTRAVHTDAVPTLNPLPGDEAARALLRQLHVAQDSALIQQTFGGSGARLLFHLARLVGGLRCATLTVGRLGERADRICEAFDQLGGERAEANA